jgi:murein DD-endopeptidase MepM/ murein hydrolase activator NlpD
MSNTPSIDPLGTAGPDAAQGSAQPSQAQLRLLAAQFESLLLSQMLRDMRSISFDDDESTGFGGGPLTDALISELGLALSRAGGFGLGQALLEPLQRETMDAADPDGAAALASKLLSAPASIELGAGTRGLPIGVEATSMPLAGAFGSPATVAIQGRLSSAYGWRQDPITGAEKFHRGADIAMPEGRDVPSAMAGKVTFAGDRGGYGLMVIVDHGNGKTTRYAHLSEISVAAGDQVAAGQTVGKAGSTGRATGPHLHFELLEEGKVVDPSGFLAPEEPRA